MRKLVLEVALFSSLAITGAFAAPVPGFEAQYAAVVAACTTPGGAAACEIAINAYSAALVGSVDLAVANQSFAELRAEIQAANASDPTLQVAVGDLFETLLPESGSLGDTDASAN